MEVINFNDRIATHFLTDTEIIQNPKANVYKLPPTQPWGMDEKLPAIYYDANKNLVWTEEKAKQRVYLSKKDDPPGTASNVRIGERGDPTPLWILDGSSQRQHIQEERAYALVIQRSSLS